MIFPILAAAALQAGPLATHADRYERCVDLARTDPAAARAEALRWRASGGAAARGCAGLAFAAEKNWAAAAAEFEAAADLAKDARTATFRAEAGNAWLAAGAPDKARADLNAALDAGTLTGLALGEAQLDRARALVAANDPEAARDDIDRALVNAGDDPLAWLLSATLARRMDNLPRARADIAQALRRAADDASVQLEAGNIAALGHDEAAAREAWAQAARIQPNGPAGRSAVVALRQFDVPAATAANPAPVAPAAAATPAAKPKATR